MDAAKALERLVQNRLKPLPLGPLPAEIRPADTADGYRLQDLLHGRLTALGFGPLGGHKIGCTTPVMQRYLGIDSPCAGGIFARTAHDRTVRLRQADYHRLGVECEIAVRLGRDLAATAAPFAAGQVADAVAAVMVAIELVDDRYQDYRTMDVATLIADDFFNAGCVLGEPVEDWRKLDLKAVTGRMTVNGEPVGQGRGGDILGDPLAALAWLAQSRAARGHDLRAGEFVLLGSIVQTRWIAAGDRVTAEVDGLGQVQMELDLMPRFSANLSWLFQEAPFLDRFALAAEAGFEAVEFLFPYDHPPEVIRAQLDAHRLTQILFNAPPGDWAAGERGLGALPGREPEFRAGVERALDYAAALDCRLIHVLAGVAPADATHRAKLIENLKWACQHAAKGGVTLLVEALNTTDVPGYFYNRTADVVAVIDAVAEPNLKLQLDLYHLQMMEGALATRVRALISRAGHVQIAGVPGRHEPDWGEINYPFLFDLLDELGYAGWVGAEYGPRAGTLAGLGWWRRATGRAR